MTVGARWRWLRSTRPRNGSVGIPALRSHPSPTNLRTHYKPLLAPFCSNLVCLHTRHVSAPTPNRYLSAIIVNQPSGYGARPSLADARTLPTGARRRRKPSNPRSRQARCTRSSTNGPFAARACIGPCRHATMASLVQSFLSLRGQDIGDCWVGYCM